MNMLTLLAATVLLSACRLYCHILHIQHAVMDCALCQVVYSMTDVPLGFGTTAKSTTDARSMDPGSIVVRWC